MTQRETGRPGGPGPGALASAHCITPRGKHGAALSTAPNHRVLLGNRSEAHIMRVAIAVAIALVLVAGVQGVPTRDAVLVAVDEVVSVPGFKASRVKVGCGRCIHAQL